MLPLNSVHQPSRSRFSRAGLILFACLLVASMVSVHLYRRVLALGLSSDAQPGPGPMPAGIRSEVR